MNVIVPDPCSYDHKRIAALKDHLAHSFFTLMADDDLRAGLFPPKQMMTIATWGGEDFSDVRTSALLGNIPEIASGGKIIHVNESERIQSAATVLFTDGGHDVVVVDAGWLTTLRCALMAAIAVERFLPEIGPQTAVGLAGLGKINLLTAQVLHDLWGVREFIVRGSKSNRLRNATALAEAMPGVRVWSDATPQMEVLADAACIISCTTNNYRNDTADFDNLANVPLFVAQDDGYWLGPSFRQALPSLSDHPEQHRGHWRDEFPWDDACPDFLNLASTALPKGTPVAVYLFGIALADLVVALDAWRYDDKRK